MSITVYVRLCRNTQRSVSGYWITHCREQIIVESAGKTDAAHRSSIDLVRWEVKHRPHGAFLNTTTALWPPKAKELETTVPTGASRASLGT